MLQLCESTNPNPQRKAYFLIVAREGEAKLHWLVPSYGGLKWIMLQIEGDCTKPQRATLLIPSLDGKKTEERWINVYWEVEKVINCTVIHRYLHHWVAIYTTQTFLLSMYCFQYGLNIQLLGTTVSPRLNTCKRLPSSSKLAVVWSRGLQSTTCMASGFVQQVQSQGLVVSELPVPSEKHL